MGTFSLEVFMLLKLPVTAGDWVFIKYGHSTGRSAGVL